MDNISKEIQAAGKEIEQMLRNFNKDSIDRKTVAYVEKRLASLNEKFELFESLHAEMVSKQGADPLHPYFQSGFYEQVKSGYNKLKGKLLDRQNELQPKAEQSRPLLEFSFNEDLDDDYEVKRIALIKKQKANFKMLDHLLMKINENMSESSRYYCELQIEKINKFWSSIVNTNLTIWEVYDVDAPDDYSLDDYFDVEARVNATLVSLMQILDRFTAPAILNSRPTMKLPKISVPIFDGDYLKWHQFHDIFNQMIDQTNISNSEKMFYLNNSLIGEAKALIQHLPTTNENYVAAWQIIKSRYDNKRVIVASLLNKLLSQPTVQQDNISSIKSLHDVTVECCTGLKNAGIPVDSWDIILLHILIKKLDRSTHSLYEQQVKNPTELQNLKDFLTFLELRFQSLESLGPKTKQYQSDDKPKSNSHFKNSNSKVSSFVGTGQHKCKLDNGDHQLYKCPKFISMKPADRYNVVKSHKLCYNCLKDTHNSSDCKSGGCKVCNKKHNSLLHFDSSKSQNSTNNSSKQMKSTNQHNRSSNESEIQSTKQGSTESNATTAYGSNSNDHVFLATAIINTYNIHGQPIECRALLDCGSQINLITKSFSKKLGFKLKESKLKINGIGDSNNTASKRFNVTIESKIINYSRSVEVFVLDKIVHDQPAQDVNINNWKIPSNIKLADPKFNESGKIDMLIGAEFYIDLLMVGQISLNTTTPVLQNTVFGWVVIGKLNQTNNNNFPTCSISTIDGDIQKLWEMDEIVPCEEDEVIACLDQQCEQFFQNTTHRNAEGRFVVNLPLVENTSQLGNSSITAKRRFLALERRLDKNPEVKAKYSEFLDEYENLGHMTETNENELPDRHYFIPHHCVLKPSSSTTKLRVVFDASCKTTTNISLNDIMHIGPKIQNDIFDILIRFRQHKYVFTGDIEKMYRQIIVNNDDTYLQLIYWRKNSSSKLKCYKLETVTYGTASAPYLSIKCLQVLGSNFENIYPKSSKAIKQDFYVDDLMTGSNDLQTAIKTRNEINNILSSAGFKLRKWCANHPDLLAGLPKDEIELQLDISGSTENHTKTLGITWIPSADKIAIKTTWNNPKRVTKRTILSDVAHIFDPLGLVSPVVIIAKIFIQELWKLKLDWDAALPQDLHSKWISFREQLQLLNGISFDRRVTTIDDFEEKQIHFFSDASSKAYGSVVYVRSTNNLGNVTVKLLCSKSRVAPTKVQTIPRLELQAAKLSVELAAKLMNILELKKENVYFWSDSKIVLDWINSQSSIFNVFVANRISYIQRHSDALQWRHVSTKNNPADHISRGIFPDKIKSTTMWFDGPAFLQQDEADWMNNYCSENTPELERKTKVSILNISIENLHFIFRINHKNSFIYLRRVTAYVLKARNIFVQKSTPNPFLSMLEINNATKLIIRELQHLFFSDEIKRLKNKQQLPNQNRLSSLTPFLDIDGIMRVGGRLTEADLPFDAKHPMLLPANHEFTEIIMTELHMQNHHIGPQALLAITRQKFWPLKGKVIANKIVHHCMKCFKAKPEFFSQIMGELPTTRVQPGRPFINAGVDYAGPIWTHYRGRGSKAQKSYIAVFCCLATKALHIEIVSDLSSNGFIGALRRFWSRRGNCNRIFLDNATNFKGAQTQLTELYQLLNNNTFKDTLNHVGSEKGIEFCFIPPRAPHMGGIWEAAVKSVKQLLIRTIGNASLTYEELCTLVTEIEAILNSRPISPVSDNPNDLAALTPAHFLIGDTLTSIADPEIETTKLTLVTRWKLVSAIKNQFWKRWSKEYLSNLQHRYKWKTKCQNATPGLMVLIKEDNLPPTKWILGRIINTYPGKDELVRVVDLKTTSGIIKRPIHKLCPLPMKPVSEHPALNDKSESEKIADTPTTEKPENKVSMRQTRSQKMKLSSLLLTVLFIPMVFAQNKKQSFQTIQFDSNPGIFFENIGLTKLINNEWNLVTYYDLQDYWAEFNIFNHTLQQLDSLCNISHSVLRENLCTEISMELKYNMLNIQQSNELLRQNVIPHPRVKRGAINFVGSIANKLFGVLDEDYATEISKVIKNMDKKEMQMASMIQQQTTIIETTSNILKQTQEQTDKDFEIIKNYLEQLKTQSNEQKLQNLFSALSLKLMLAIHRYQSIQTQIIDVLLDARSGKINPLLITPDQLKESFSSISNQLPPKVELPFNKFNEKDVINLYRLTHTTTRVMEHYLIFRLQLPLVSQDELEMYRLIPVPLLLNGSVARIKPSSPYLTVSLYKDVFYPMTELEVSQCQRPDDEIILCKQTHPLYNKVSELSKCEMELLNHKGITKSCIFDYSENLPEWTQLQNPNQWVFSVREETLVNVVCGSDSQSAKLNKMGILTVDKNCMIKLPTLTIGSHNVFPSELRSSFVPSVETHQLNLPASNNELEPFISIQNHQLKELQNVKNQINILKDTQFDLDSSQPHEIHQFTISYLAAIFAISAIIFMIWNCWKSKQQIIRKPVPAPRRSSTMDFSFNDNSV